MTEVSLARQRKARTVEVIVLVVGSWSGWQLDLWPGWWRVRVRSNGRDPPDRYVLLILGEYKLQTINVVETWFEAFNKSKSVNTITSISSGLHNMHLLGKDGPNKDTCYQYHIECHVVDILKLHNFRSHSNSLHFIANRIWMYDTMDDSWLTDLPEIHQVPGSHSDVCIVKALNLWNTWFPSHYTSS